MQGDRTMRSNFLFIVISEDIGVNEPMSENVSLKCRSPITVLNKNERY